MIGNYFHKHSYEYYPKHPVRVVEYLANASDQTYFLKESSLYAYYLLFVISLFFKVYFCTSIANMLFYQLYLMVLRLRLGCKKRLVVFRWTNGDLDGAVLKNVWCQISATIYRLQLLILCLTYLLTVTVSVTVLHEKEFYSTCILWYFWSITSTMFIDNKAVLFLLIMPMIPFVGCM